MNHETTRSALFCVKFRIIQRETPQKIRGNLRGNALKLEFCK